MRSPTTEVSAGRRAGNAHGSPAGIAIAGLVALAVAMGIGRFAFTPIMPMMETDAGLTLAAAGWLAAANYLGYFLGALCAARLSLAQAVRGGLLLIAGVTFAMGVTHVFALQLVLRLLAGVASAWVLVHVSAWALERLLALGRPDANGILYAGVGVGVAAAGLVVMGGMHVRWDSGRTWQVFGVLSLLTTMALWRAFRDDRPQPRVTKAASPRIHWNADKRRLMWCYGALGFGYIIPATFLPDMAHRYITDPLVFGLAWPVFGAASALSTWIAARWLARVNDRRLWAICYLLMTAGVALPALWPTLTAILVAALLVGGTYMVVTMLGLREASRVAGAEATGFIAVMTAAFAIGQIIGPLLVSAVAHLPHGFAAALLAAAVVLLAAAMSLWRSAGEA
ncbi:MAG TPA: YbfB/YjiJ family MFS transporter [Rhodanobacteraceae bacterium]|nr:YbfB/YjiJ family MFS transporter [Rhodanobacteraceae bacterium]